MLYGLDHKFTQLIPPLGGDIDPDDAYCRVPYEKGSCLLFYLETIIGDQGKRPSCRQRCSTPAEKVDITSNEYLVATAWVLNLTGNFRVVSWWQLFGSWWYSYMLDVLAGIWETD